MKNKIHNYDFLVIGSGLIGSLTAISLLKHKYRVLVIDKNKKTPKDNRTTKQAASKVIKAVLFFINFSELI